jgi:asparagine synthase (glutamine-hydrolysing)
LDLEHDLDELIWQLDEPQTEVSALYVSSIAKMAREKGFIVLLSGMGGDDLFAGYRRHKAILYDEYLFKSPYLFRKALAEFSKYVPVQYAPLRRLKKFLVKFRERNIQSGSANYYKWLSNDRAIMLFNPDIRKELTGYDGSDVLIESLAEIPDEHNPLNQMLYWDMHYFLPDHNLNYTDKMSMKHGVEVRVPYCDTELVNLSASIPPHLKMKHGIPKYLLKKVAERYLPKELIYRPKTGFGGPLREWITNDFKTMVDRKLSREMLEENRIFEYSEVRKLIDDNLSGKIDASYSILSLIGIQAWMKTFLNSQD